MTTVAYDLLGRRTVIDNPDTGRTTYTYDPASNLIAKVTANLAAQGKAITYDYDYDRLTAIHYPDFPQNDVTYAYGPPGAPDNQAGRIRKLTDAAGTEVRAYDALGNLTQTTRTVNLRAVSPGRGRAGGQGGGQGQARGQARGQTGAGPTSPAYTTGYVYDDFGRLQRLTYPDGEVLADSGEAGQPFRFMPAPIPADAGGCSVETGNALSFRW